LKTPNILTKEQEDKGLSVKEDEDLVYLLDPKGYPIAKFSSNGVTKKVLQAEAQKYIEGVKYDT